jgi:hypothetical protein
MRQIHFFVEGNDDVLFMNAVVRPICLLHQVQYNVFAYSQEKVVKTSAILQTHMLRGEDCFFLADKDSMQYRTIEQRKHALYHRYQLPDQAHCVVVVEEIESWYLAGLPHDVYTELCIGRYYDGTNTITKEQFNAQLAHTHKASKGRSVILLRYLLRRFDVDIACERNRSFLYFYNTLLRVLNTSDAPLSS